MAVSKKITKKVISKKLDSAKKIEEKVESAPQKTGCFFCQSKKNPTFLDLISLKKYISDRGKIIPALRSGVCSKHQRQVAKGVKQARYLSLLPFTPKV